MFYWTYRSLTALASSLPRSLQYWCAYRFADAWYLLGGPKRRAVQANMRAVLGPEVPEAAVRREARWVFRSFGVYLCEFFGYRQFGPRYMDACIEVQGREHLDAALAGGRGALFVSGHYSNWEIAASKMAHLGYPIVIVTQEHDDPRVNELFVSQRERHGVTVRHTKGGARAALRGLRENRPVAILADRTTGGPTVEVELFGRRTPLPQGPWYIAAETGAPVLPTFMHRRTNFSYVVHVGAPLYAARTGTRDEKAAALAQAWARHLEARIRTDPAQWTVFYPVWPDEDAAPAQNPSEAAPRIALPQPKPTTPAPKDPARTEGRE